MERRVFVKLCGIFVLFSVFSGFVSAASTVGYTNLNRLAIATTTTVNSQESEVRCEAVKNANEKTCMDGICSAGYECEYVQSAAAANVGYCKCMQKSTTTTMPAEVRCEAIKGPNEKTCIDGICPVGYDCDYVPSAAAANVGYCKCVSTTTTTQSSEVRCEAVKYPSANACAAGVCPQGAKCRYVASTTAVANIGACKCVYDATTTTLGSQEMPCERILKPSSASNCAGACPQGTRCMFKPKVQTTANLAALSPSGESSCVCVEYTTTTTLYPKCEDIKEPSGPVCKRGLCPPDSVCRYRSSGQQATTALLVAHPVGSCDCVPCDCVDSTTTTTIPQQVLCERVVSPSDATCEAGLCPDNQECRVFTAVVGNGKISKCACVGETTTTTQPSNSCDGLISSSGEKCAQASCPAGFKCKYYPPAATTAANSVGYCKCVEETTPTTVPGVTCEAITATGEQSCVGGKCPANLECKYTPVAGANIGKCKCVEKQATTTLRQAPVPQPVGFLDSILKAIFG